MNDSLFSSKIVLFDQEYLNKMANVLMWLVIVYTFMCR